MSSHACVTYRRQKLTGAAALAHDRVGYRCHQGSWCLWQAKLWLAVFVLVDSKMFSHFLCYVLWVEGGIRVQRQYISQSTL